MIKDLALKSWNIINSGSLEVEVAQEKGIAAINLDKNNLVVDVKNPGAPLIFALKNIISHDVRVEGEESREVKASSKIIDKKDEIKNLLNRAGDIASFLAENKKTFILKHKGKELLKIGEGASSLLPVLRKKHIQIPSKIALLRFLIETR